MVVCLLPFSLGYGVDTEPSYNDELGWYYYLGFPYNQATLDYMNEFDHVSAWLDEESNTFIDIEDSVYNLYPSVFNNQVDQLTFLQWFNYIHHAYRFISPIEKLYMRADNGIIVQCYPHYNGEGYEMICYPTS